jgi:long-chain acyl-CoA synthetase
MCSGGAYGYGPDTVTLLSTPLYSNTTLVVFFPTLAFGGTVVLMPKFDAAAYLQLASPARHPHHAGAGAVPAADGAVPDFDAFDLSAFRMKFCTSAPFQCRAQGRGAAPLARRPGGVLRHDRRRRHLHPQGPRTSPTSCTPWAARPRATTSA